MIEGLCIVDVPGLPRVVEPQAPARRGTAGDPAMAHLGVRGQTDWSDPLTSNSDFEATGDARRRADVEELFRGVPPISSVDELAAPGVFESDEELDEFLAWVRRERNANIA